ncbi:MAG: MATE family efflux transporter, partial [Bacteroidales bacterium]|nr:MATE family efflux transporter [Bacteroidales bacterium]
FKIAERSLSIGMAPFLMNVASCFVVILINRQLQFHGGDMAIGAYGIVNRIVFLFIMLIMGFTQGMQPIAGYNYGAKLYPRVKKVLTLTIICATATTTLAFLVGELIPNAMVSLFTRDAELKELSSHALRIIVAIFPIVGFQIVATSFFQSIGYARKAIFLSLSRQLLFLLPFLIIFPRLWGTDGVWWSMPASDIVAALIALLMISRLMKTFGRDEKAILE